MYNPELSTIKATLSETPFPKKIAVEVTSECNLACAMCHHPAMKRPKGRMPFELWTKCATQIAATARQTECWFSFIGEPLLEPDLVVRMIAHGKSLGLQSLNLNTNGMLLTQALVKPIIDSGVDLVVFGLDGFSPDVFEKIRVGAKRDVVYANVEFFLNARNGRPTAPEVQVQFIEMDQNTHEIGQFSEYWLARGATLKLRNKLSWGGKFETPLCIAPHERIACPWAMTMMHLFWDGRVPRCPGDTEGEEGVGNAWDEPLANLWQRLRVYREHHMNHRFDLLPERCQKCKDWMVGSAKRIRPSTPQPDPIASGGSATR